MITPAKIIQKKRDGGELSPQEIQAFIRGLTSGEVADYQATAFLMATFFQGMTLDETVSLTRAMLDSGEKCELKSVPGFKVDKHSTGGVGDKVSLILAPLAAACGLKVPMMAGRGLGHSGGTLDKLESITGFETRPTPKRFEDILRTVGCAIIGQSEKVAPADKKLYALRDVTATVDCIPLIVASILSKKAAEGTQGLVMDVKVGNGAFMKSRAEARKLAQTLVDVGGKLGLQVRALLTDMNQPLGYAVGNAIEVQECIEIMRAGIEPAKKPEGHAGSGDLKELTIQLCSHMIEMAEAALNRVEARKLAHQKLADGSAWQKFQAMVEAQGGSLAQIASPSKLPRASRSLTWKAPKRGYLSAIDTQAIGEILVELGGGRKRAADSVDFGVGLVFHAKLGTRLQTGDPIATAFVPAKFDIGSIEKTFYDSLEITGSRKPVPRLILETLI
jgi:pyrimidine-nucleoside phosphorylase